MGFFSVGYKIYMVGGAVITFGLKDVASRNCCVFEPWHDSLHSSWSMMDGPPMHKEKLKPICSRLSQAARAVLCKIPNPSLALQLSPSHCLVPARQSDDLILEHPSQSIEAIGSAHRPFDGRAPRSASGEHGGHGSGSPTWG